MISKAVVGAANTIVAAICRTTDQRPAEVCAAPPIQALQGLLG